MCCSGRVNLIIYIYTGIHAHTRTPIRNLARTKYEEKQEGAREREREREAPDRYNTFTSNNYLANVICNFR